MHVAFTHPLHHMYIFTNKRPFFTHVFCHIKILTPETGEIMAQGLRLHAALTADQSSGPCTHIRWCITACHSSSRGSQTFALWHLFSCAHTEYMLWVGHPISNDSCIFDIWPLIRAPAGEHGGPSEFWALDSWIPVSFVCTPRLPCV